MRQRYYTPRDVAKHCTSDNLWVSFLGHVYDLTLLHKKHKGDPLMKPILMYAGKDISHWFDAKTGDIQSYVDPVSKCVMPYTPHGPFIHVPPSYPSSAWANDFPLPWWKDKSYCIGCLTSKARLLRIVNTLISREQTLEVCCEDSISDIEERYKEYNVHAGSYTWKYDGVALDMDKTLEENGISNEDELFYKLKMNKEDHIPALHIYFNDDLSEY